MRFYQKFPFSKQIDKIILIKVTSIETIGRLESTRHVDFPSPYKFHANIWFRKKSCEIFPFSQHMRVPGPLLTQSAEWNFFMKFSVYDHLVIRKILM